MFDFFEKFLSLKIFSIDIINKFLKINHLPIVIMSKNFCSNLHTRINHQIKCKSSNEECSVIDETGIICGETDNLNIFEEFRLIYEECLKKLEGCPDYIILRVQLFIFLVFNVKNDCFTL